jgi:hypothetical protein
MKAFLKVLLVVLVLLLAMQLLARQNNQSPVAKAPVSKGKAAMKDSAKYKDTLAERKKFEKERDITDVYRSVFKLKPKPQKADSLTKKPTYTVIPAIGYTLVSKLSAVVTGNTAYKTGPDARESTVTASASFSITKQFTFFLESSNWSKNNKYNFVADYRFYQYPQSTFGLGSSSNIKHEDPMDYRYVRIYQTVLRHVTGNLYMGGGYIIDNHWGITDKGYFNDYSSYTSAHRSTSSGFTLNAIADTRDNAINPLKGNLFNIQYRDNLNFLGSSTPWSSLIVDVRKYINFPEGSDNVLALWSFEWLTLAGRPGFLDLPSTQWDTYSATGRGYIQGRFRGADMVYAEAEYRYRILDNGLIGGVFFLNGESLNAAPGTRLQGVQPGFGPGLRIKLNKLSKTNISIDYGFGREGSNGLFIDVGEIF